MLEKGTQRDLLGSGSPQYCRKDSSVVMGTPVLEGNPDVVEETLVLRGPQGWRGTPVLGDAYVGGGAV